MIECQRHGPGFHTILTSLSSQCHIPHLERNHVMYGLAVEAMIQPTSLRLYIIATMEDM